MSYEVRDIRDRVAVGDDCFWLEKLSDGRYRLVPAPDSITEVGTSVDRALLQPMENEIARLAKSLPETSTSDSGKALVVGADGKYALGEAGAKDAVLYTPQTLTEEQKAQARANIGAGDSEVSADKITAGTFAGMVHANEAAQADLTTAQLRNVAVLLTDPGNGVVVDYPVGTVIVTP